MANKPYTLKLNETNTSFNAKNGPQTRVTETNVYRDSSGRVCIEALNGSRQPKLVSVRDPVKNTFTFINIEGKSASVGRLTQPAGPPQGKGWVVERLPSRIIEGVPTDGLRFTRTVAIPATASSPDTIIEEDWVSDSLGVVLEKKIESKRDGTIIRTIITTATQFTSGEPDPAVFTIPSGYSVTQAGTATP